MLNNKYAWTTVLTKSKYEMSAGRLYQAFKYFKSKYPMEILVTDNLNEQDLPFLTQNNIPYQKVRLLEFKPSLNPDIGDRFTGTLSKLNILSLFNYDLVCCIDADDIILNNIDVFIDGIDKTFSSDFLLYEYNHKNIETGKNLHTGPIGGVFYAKPSIKAFSKALKLASIEQSIEDNDKRLLELAHVADEHFFKVNYPECVFELPENIYNYPNKNLVAGFSGKYKYWEFLDFLGYKEWLYNLSIEEFIKHALAFKQIQLKINDISSILLTLEED